MTRHHGYWKSICTQCANFKDNKCEGKNLRFKKFETTKLPYVDLEIPVFHDSTKGSMIKILPNMRYVSYNTSCSIFETWLNNTIDKLIEETPEAVRCDTYKEFRYD